MYGRKPRGVLTNCSEVIRAEHRGQKLPGEATGQARSVSAERDWLPQTDIDEDACLPHSLVGSEPSLVLAWPSGIVCWEL